MNEKEKKLHLNLSKFFEPIDSNPTLEQGTEIMNYYNDIYIILKFLGIFCSI